MEMKEVIQSSIIVIHGSAWLTPEDLAAAIVDIATSLRP